MRKTIWAAFATAVLGTGLVQAANPYLPLWEFIPDGEPHVFEDPDNPGKYRVYIYGSHDELITQYCSRNQVLWSAPVDNPNEWRYEGVIFESKLNAEGKALNPYGLGDILYAPDITEVKEADGTKTYYFYPNVQHELRSGCIAKSKRPNGPFEVCNWDPKNPNRTTGVLAFDPSVFVDDDGRVYGYWGFERSFAAELDPTTMCTIKPGSPVIEDMIPGRYAESDFHFFEASSIRKIKDKYVLVYSRFAPEGEQGLPETNYTLAYAWSNSPLGPWKYGGVIIDARGLERQADGSMRITAVASGNTHGSILEVDGRWWVFYHRQTGTDDFQRQAMVGAITVEVTEGPEGDVKISEAEFTSEGFETSGLNPLDWHSAGIACYFTGRKPARAEYPNVYYSGSYIQAFHTEHDDATPAYDKSTNICHVVHNTDGSAVGYKYFNLTGTYCMKQPSLMLTYIPEGVEGDIEIWLDRPTDEPGTCYKWGTDELMGAGNKLATFHLTADMAQVERTDCIPINNFARFEGKHALFFTFKSDTKNKSLCKLVGFQVVGNQEEESNSIWIIVVVGIIGILCFYLSIVKRPAVEKELEEEEQEEAEGKNEEK